MKLRKLYALATFITLASYSWASCPGGGSPTNNWCGPYSVPLTVTPNGSDNYNGCLTGTGYIGCANSRVSAGYSQAFTVDTTGMSATWTFTSIIDGQYTNGWDNDEISAPNGAAGNDDYLESAGGLVQAYVKSYDSSGKPNGTLGPIFYNGSSGVATTYPVSINSPFSDPGDFMNVCNQPRAEPNVSYDHISDNNFIIAYTAVPGSENGTYDGTPIMCIAVSTTDDLTECSGSPDYTGGCYWNAYSYDVSSLMPTNGSCGTEGYDCPDYPRFGTFGNSSGNYYYMTFDLLSSSGIIDGSAVCQLDRFDILRGASPTHPSDSQVGTATCWVRLNPQSPDQPTIHSICPLTPKIPPKGLAKANSSWQQ